MKFLDSNGVQLIKEYVDNKFVTTDDYSVIEDVVRDTYTKQEIDTMLAEIEGGGADLTNYYTKTESDNKYVEQVSGKTLSTNDYTTTEKNKLSGIASGAEVNVQSDWNVTDTSSDAYIKNKPTIPSAVTESTVSGWGFTKNAGTVTGSSLTADKIVLGNGGTAVKASTYGVSTTAPASSSDDTTIPTSKAVNSAINTALTSVLKYKGTVASNSELPATHSVGDVYVVSTAGTFAGKACEVGDYIICKTAGTSANDAHWDVVTGENQVENKSASLAAAGSSATIATVDGTNITVTTPSTWTGVDKTGTITGVKFNNVDATVSNGVASITATIPSAVTESTVSGWGFTKNTGTLTGVSFNGNSATVTNGVAAITATIPAAANNGTLTIQKNGTTVQTFTANQSSNVTANIQVNEVPSYSSSNNGQILSVVNGALAWITPSYIYSGSATPNNSTGNNGDIYLQT